MYKKAQEEIVGFGLIIIIVAVIFVIILAFMISDNSEKNIESEEVNAYIHSLLQYTTDCETYIEFMSVEKLIAGCLRKDVCLDSREMCDVLQETITKISDSSWSVGNKTPVKAYKFEILDKQGEIITKTEKGVQTGNSKGAMQNLPNSDIIFSVYY